VDSPQSPYAPPNVTVFFTCGIAYVENIPQLTFCSKPFITSITIITNDSFVIVLLLVAIMWQFRDNDDDAIDCDNATPPTPPEGTPTYTELINQENPPPTPRNLNSVLHDPNEIGTSTHAHTFNAEVDADGDIKHAGESFRGCDYCQINGVRYWGGDQGVVAAGAWNFNVHPNLVSPTPSADEWVALPKRDLHAALTRRDDERFDWQEEHHNIRDKQLEAEHKLVIAEKENNKLHQLNIEHQRKLQKLWRKLNNNKCPPSDGAGDEGDNSII